MSLFKEKITEKEIAEAFFGSIIKNVADNWQNIRKELDELFIKMSYGGFNVVNEDDAKMATSFVLFALEFHTLKKIFPDRADRIYSKMLAFIESTNKEKNYVKQRIDLYQEKFRESIQLHAQNKYHSPFENLVIQLLSDWFGADNYKFYIRNTKVVNPILIGALGHILVSLVGFWKNANNNFVLVEEEEKNQKQDPKNRKNITINGEASQTLSLTAFFFDDKIVKINALVSIDGVGGKFPVCYEMDKEELSDFILEAEDWENVLKKNEVFWGTTEITHKGKIIDSNISNMPLWSRLINGVSGDVITLRIEPLIIKDIVLDTKIERDKNSNAIITILNFYKKQE